MKLQKLFTFTLSLALLFNLVPAGLTQAAPTVPNRQVAVDFRGESSFTVAASASLETLGNVPDTLFNQVGSQAEHDIPRGAMGRLSTLAAPTLSVPVVKSSDVSQPPANSVTGWNGISHRDQRLANNGNQFSLEPPDQGLCAGNGYVLEAVNLALAVYDTNGGVKKGVTDLNTFFNYPAVIDRTNHIYGPFTSDPKCLYDPTTGRWFVSILVLEQNSTTGAFTGVTHNDIAVSKTGDPTGAYYLYKIDTTNGDGTLPGHPGCPCLGDQPLIGLNQDAFVMSTNEFSMFGPEFNGAQIYAISKALLVRGKPLSAVVFDNLPLAEGTSYSVQPAFIVNKQSASQEADGTLYFLSALDFNATLDNRIALWALTGTNTLGSRSPDLSLDYTILSSQVYGQPPNADQKDGARPLGSALGAPANVLNSNDDRMNQVEFINGKLYAGLNTVVNVGGQDRAGLAYFVVEPSMSDKKGLSGKINKQGYLAVAGNNVLFPSLAATNDDVALMTFTLAGQDYFPSAAYARVQPQAKVFVAGAGAGPADGFTGYAAYGGTGVERWGDYSAAVTDGKTIWMAAEYIPGGPRTSLANWGTFVFGVQPDK